MKKETKFQIIGFNNYSSKILEVLLSNRIMSVKQIYDKIKIPKNKIYENLDFLKKQGIIEEELGNPKKYFLINDKIIDELISKKFNELEELQTKVEYLKKSKEKLNPSVLSLIEGQDEIHKLLEYSNSDIKEEILSCSRLLKMHYGCYRTLKEAILRGVKVKFVGLYNGKNYDVLKEYKNIGVDLRIYAGDEIFPKIGLFDSTYTRITIGSPDVKKGKDYKTIWANSLILYNIVKNHFDKVWNDSVDFEDFF